MELATMIQEKCKEIFDENYGTGKIGTIKAIGASILSGAVDGAVIAYPIVLVTKVMTKKKY